MVRLSNIHTFENGQLKQVLVDGGYIPMDDWSGTYRFYVKDHLGNNRMVVHQSGTIEQVNNYYPYGGLMANTTGWNTQRYKYNGKEFDRMHGLDWYDYGARWMDASIGRWHSMDPLCEKYYNVSPYVYCAGNPISFVDPDGMEKIIALNPNDPKHPMNHSIIKAIRSFEDDKKTINIWAHGDETSMDVDDYNAKTGKRSTCNITNHSQMEHFLQKKSEVFNNLKDGETAIVVLHSCKTGADNANNKDHSGFAQKMSKSCYKNTTGAKINVAFVAPTCDVQVGKIDGKGPFEIGAFEDALCKKPGQWNVYNNGKRIKQYKESSSNDRVQPGSKNNIIDIYTFLDKIKNFFQSL